MLQKGLNLGQPYSVPGYPAALNPATDGLRNLTGKVNADGTVTIWAVTSTVSANGDQGADPNKLVTITDVLANTTAAGAANEQFTTLKTAAAGEVLRGVSVTPVAGSTPAQNVPTILSAASPSVMAIAPGSLAFALGQGLATGTPGEILGPSPTIFDGTSVTIVDSTGAPWAAPLVFVSPWQVTFLVPAEVPPGPAKVNVTAGGVTQSAANVQIATIAPALYTLNGSGLAAAGALRVSADRTQTIELAYTLNSAGSFSANPIDMGSASDQVYLQLAGTGLQAAGTAGVKVTVGGLDAQVLFVGPQGSFGGLDQVDVQLPAALAGKGNVNVQVTAAGIPANAVQITIQ